MSWRGVTTYSSFKKNKGLLLAIKARFDEEVKHSFRFNGCTLIHFYGNVNGQLVRRGSEPGAVATGSVLIAIRLER
jgi:hypothetical protein